MKNVYIEIQCNFGTFKTNVIQINDEDYPEFSYQNGLGCLSGFDIEPHFRRSKIQMESIEKVKEEKGISIYGIYEDGGMIIDKGITCFGKIDLF